ncbi:MAG: carboxypeptidase regulatory-like domain-containing protein [Bacteroidetes bacterium]|nr:carboxypeptidase regulatory-like domain-containing protein [Bacteroidota bacterium]
MFVLDPTYVQASYLEGNVIDSIAGTPLNDVKVEILNEGVIVYTNLVGDYTTGLADSGSYNVKFSLPGYFAKTMTNVSLDNGQLTNLDASLTPKSTFTYIIKVKDLETGNPITGAKVQLTSADFTYNGVTNTQGSATFLSIFEDTYQIAGGKWGYLPASMSDVDLNETGFVELEVAQGFYDDFSLDFEWVTSGTSKRINFRKSMDAESRCGCRPGRRFTLLCYW